jgi:hypothetical protein
MNGWVDDTGEKKKELCLEKTLSLFGNSMAVSKEWNESVCLLLFSFLFSFTPIPS